jgi:hypothetical protein
LSTFFSIKYIKEILQGPLDSFKYYQRADRDSSTCKLLRQATGTISRQKQSGWQNPEMKVHNLHPVGSRLLP